MRKSWWDPPWQFKEDKENADSYKQHKCAGKVIKSICNFGAGDLAEMWAEADEERCLSANKFNLNVDPVAVVCQAKEIVRRTEELYGRMNNGGHLANGSN